MKLQCIDVSIKDGLFNWGNNAYIYYYIQERGSNISGKQIYFNYYVSGKKEETVERLYRTFKSVIEKIYGPLIEDRVEENTIDKKKVI